MGKAELTKTKRCRLFDAHYAKLKNSGLWLQLSPLLWTKLLTRRLMFYVLYTHKHHLAAGASCIIILHGRTVQESDSEMDAGKLQTFMVVGRGGGGSWTECRCSSWVDQSLLCLFWNSTVFVIAALILEEYTGHSNEILFCWCLLCLLSVNSWLDKWRWIMGFGLCGTHVLGSGNGHLADAGPLIRGQRNMVLKL